MTIRKRILAAVEREQRVTSKRIEKLRTCDLEVLKRALETFESPACAGQWLIEELAILGGKAPVDAIATRAGRTAVLQSLGRIDHGIFS